MALVSTGRLATVLQNPGLSADLLTVLANAASMAVEGYCGRTFAYQNWIEFYTTNGTRHIVLRQRPVARVNHLWLDYDGNFGTTSGAFGSTAELFAGTDWALEFGQGGADSKSGLVARIRSIWPERVNSRERGVMTPEQSPSPGNLKVDYDAGYLVIPDDLQFATCVTAAVMLRYGVFGTPLQAETLGRASYELARRHEWLNPDLGSARQVLSKYRDSPW